MRTHEESLIKAHRFYFTHRIRGPLLAAQKAKVSIIMVMRKQIGLSPGNWISHLVLCVGPHVM